MPKLDDYGEFAGRHWETGTVRNFLAYRGVTAPHTGRPYSEALLLGVSGGATMGYFSFAYEGYEPQARILTRNTFDPWDTMLSRLGVTQHLAHTSKPDKGVANLVEALAEGVPAIVWADMFSLPYNGLAYDERNWAMLPILVYGYDETAATAWIADRARVPLTITTAELDAARARVKKDKFRLITLDPPLPEKLPAAVQAGIWDCLKLYTEKPPKGTKNNFGLAAFRWWAELLTRPKTRLSWAKEFPPGSKMLAGLMSAYHDINLFGKAGNAERDVYANFLEEAAVILAKPALTEAAQAFRRSAGAWQELSQALLPDEVQPFGEIRQLMQQRHQLFLDQGSAALDEVRQVDERLERLKAAVSADFPLSESEVLTMRQTLADHVLRLHDMEQAAVMALREAMIA